MSPAKSNDQSTTQSAKPGEPDAVALPWRVDLHEFDMQDWQVRWEDLTLPIPALLRVDNLALNVKGISTDLTQPVQLAPGFQLNDGGTISVRAAVRALAGKVDLDGLFCRIPHAGLFELQHLVRAVSNVERVVETFATSHLTMIIGDELTNMRGL